MTSLSDLSDSNDWERYKNQSDRTIIEEIVRRSDEAEERFDPSPAPMRLAGPLFCEKHARMIVHIARRYLTGWTGRRLSPEEMPSVMLIHFRDPPVRNKNSDEEDDPRPWRGLRKFLQKNRECFGGYLGRSTHNWMQNWNDSGRKGGGSETPSPDRGPDESPSGPSGLEHFAASEDASGNLESALDAAYHMGKFLEAIEDCISGGRRNRFEGNVKAAKRALALQEAGTDSDVIAEILAEEFGIVCTGDAVRQWISRARNCMKQNYGDLYDDYFGS